MSTISGSRKLKKALAKQRKIRSELNTVEEQTIDNDYLENKLGLKLGYIDNKADEDENINKSILHTLKSFIPLTKEYYEYKAATTELDDYDRIHNEKIKALELVLQVKQGMS